MYTHFQKVISQSNRYKPESDESDTFRKSTEPCTSCIATTRQNRLIINPAENDYKMNVIAQMCIQLIMITGRNRVAHELLWLVITWRNRSKTRVM